MIFVLGFNCMFIYQHVQTQIPFLHLSVELACIQNKFILSYLKLLFFLPLILIIDFVCSRITPTLVQLITVRLLSQMNKYTQAKVPKVRDSPPNIHLLLQLFPFTVSSSHRSGAEQAQIQTARFIDPNPVQIHPISKLYFIFTN